MRDFFLFLFGVIVSSAVWYCFTHMGTNGLEDHANKQKGHITIVIGYDPDVEIKSTQSLFSCREKLEEAGQGESKWDEWLVVTLHDYEGAIRLRDKILKAVEEDK